MISFRDFRDSGLFAADVFFPPVPDFQSNEGCCFIRRTSSQLEVSLTATSTTLTTTTSAKRRAMTSTSTTATTTTAAAPAEAATSGSMTSYVTEQIELIHAIEKSSDVIEWLSANTED